MPEACRDAGYRADIAEEGAAAGRRSALLTREEKTGDSFGNLMQTFDARPFRGKRFRLRAQVRSELAGSGDRVQLWVRVDREGGGIGFFDNMGGRPLRARQWTEVEIAGAIDGDAEYFSFGMTLLHDGKAWLDDVRFEILGEAGEGDEPARALSDRGLDNLTAFARLFGVVRYFHPSDGARQTDWEAFARQGVRRVEGAESPRELAQVLGELFGAMAPSAGIFPTEDPPAPGPAAPAPQEGAIIAWRHHGVGLGNPGRYRSTLVDGSGPPDDHFGNLTQYLVGEPYRGRTVRLSAAVKTDLEEGKGQVQLWLRVDRPNRAMGFFDNMADRPISSGEWRDYVIEGEVDADATGIALGVILLGTGRAWIDDVSLTVDGGEIPAEDGDFVLENTGFEEGEDGEPPPGWQTASLRPAGIYRRSAARLATPSP